MKFREWLQSKCEWHTGGGPLGNQEPLLPQNDDDKKYLKPKSKLKRYKTIMQQNGTQGTKIDPGA
jgi:hypothetical protein